MRTLSLALLLVLFGGQLAFAGGDSVFNQQGTFDPAAACAKALGVESVKVQSETNNGGGSATIYFDKAGRVVSGTSDLPQWRVDIVCGCYWSRGRFYLFGLISRVIPYCGCFTTLWEARYVDANKDGKIGPGDKIGWEGVPVPDTMAMASGDDTGAVANLAMQDALANLINAQGSTGPGQINFP